jgi:glutathionyl-hydroquinone reductase
MFNDAFDPLARNAVDLFPTDIEPSHAELSAFIYEHVNNGVYKAGFAGNQQAYEHAFRALFDALDHLDDRLSTRRFLFGQQPVEADWRLFCTLIRFDAVYYLHFKCNLRRIVDFKNLDGYLLDLYQSPGIADTVNFDHIKRHYYLTHHDINPAGLVPLGPELDFTQPSERVNHGS